MIEKPELTDLQRLQLATLSAEMMIKHHNLIMEAAHKRGEIIYGKTWHSCGEITFKPSETSAEDAERILSDLEKCLPEGVKLTRAK